MAKKTVNSDIYNLLQLVNDLKSLFIPDETEETLAIGTYGYIGALESNRLQTQVQMTGELCNEVFPSRARLERNVITHAIMANIENINAVPSKMTAFLAIKESDILKYFDSDNIFIIDRECPLYIGDYEFHLEYDIKLKKIYIEKKGTNTYTAQYIIPDGRDVPTSTISSNNQYLNPPAVIMVNNDAYIYLTVILSQVEHYTVSKKLVTSNIIDNKTINFEFENQLAYFEVHCSESDQDYYIIPVFEGSAIPDSNTQYYCWYQYIDTNLIRVRFDRQSYMPGLNANIECLVKTCQGSSGNFNYGEDVYVSLESSKYGYKGITSLLTPVTDSSGGKDRKSKRELQGLIPKESLSRGSLTTITDLNNYFGMLDSEYGRIVIQKKIDNQIERVYYAYFVAKDSNSNIIPSNTINIKVGLEDLIESKITESGSSRYLLPSGLCFRLGDDGIGYINKDPLLETGQVIIPNAVARGQVVEDTFTVQVTDDTYNTVSCSVDIDGVSTPTYVFPSETENERYRYVNSSSDTIVEDYIQMGVGNKYTYTAEYVTKEDDSIIRVRDKYLNCLDFLEGYYTINGTTKYFNTLPVTVYNLPKNTKVSFGITRRMNNKAKGIVYFTLGEKTYKLSQKSECILSSVLYNLGITDGKVKEAVSGDGSIISLTESGFIGDSRNYIYDINNSDKPYVLNVVNKNNTPPISEREENNWYYVIENTEDQNITNSDKPYVLNVVDKKNAPPISEREENNWYYVVHDTTEKAQSDNSNTLINSDKPYVLNVENQEDMPPISEREENNWWYSITGVAIQEKEQDDPDQPEMYGNLNGKEYKINVLKNFEGSSTSIMVTVDDEVYEIGITQDRHVLENGLYVYEGISDVQRYLYTTFIPTLDQSTWPTELNIGQQITYTLKYKSTSNRYTPNITVKLSRGLEYILFSNKIKYPNGSIVSYEPNEISLEKSNGFIYTNPYSVNINGYRLYSSFYMMTMSENPYLHFDYINDKSNVQFISTNCYWERQFSEENKNKYTLNVTLTQSVQDDIGVIPYSDGSPLIKAVAVFKRNNKDYRYRSLRLKSYDPSNYSFSFTQDFESKDIFDNDNNLKVTNFQVVGQSEYVVTLKYNSKEYIINNGGDALLSSIISTLGIEVGDIEKVESSNKLAIDTIPIYNGDSIIDYKVISFIDFSEEISITLYQEDGAPIIIKATSTQPAVSEYGFFEPNTEMKIYVLCGIPDVDGSYSRNNFDSIYPGLKNWTLTNVFDVVNGVTFYHNYSEIMGSRVKPYGNNINAVGANVTMDLEGYYICGVPMLGYDYCKDEIMVQSAINAINYRKAYIDSAINMLENSFGVDFKLFNTYGPSNIYYIIKDSNNNGVLDDKREYIDRVNLTLNFRVKLTAENDSYTKSNIVQDIKKYIEELDDISELHIPNLIAQITTNYKEQITYFEYLGFNEYGANIQHIYKDNDKEIPIHTAPEFLNVNNINNSTSGTIPDINIYVSEI